ncbi:DUF3040 domain-containing protein [Dactylosporangium sp. NPDC005555]|uniref:DUF3040 domain-containing protein n=1 Tax=Dactylosporangium sp. NPDC005555 TaxID=3154889 RepID=UPI0033A41EB3
MLNDDELWRLRQIEQQIAGDDPALARTWSLFEPVMRWRCLFGARSAAGGSGRRVGSSRG